MIEIIQDDITTLRSERHVKQSPADLRQHNMGAAIDGHAERLIEKMAATVPDIEKAATVRDCVARGYAPHGYTVADFSIIRNDGTYHLFHIPRVDGGRPIVPGHEHWFGHAISQDLDTWTTQDPVLYAKPANCYESSHIWAPFVIRGPESFTMFYTGLTTAAAQCLCAARSTDPDLKIWERCETNPITPLTGFTWHWKNHQGHTRHARDPHVVKVDDHYLMVYTSMHRNGCPVVGGLVSEDLLHWEDIGPVLYRPLKDEVRWLPESVNVQQLADGKWVLMPSVSPGITYYIADTPHSWHGVEPQKIDYLSSDGDQIGGIEVLARDDENGLWLTAFFGDGRLLLGMLDITAEPWSLQRIVDRSAVAAACSNDQRSHHD